MSISQKQDILLNNIYGVDIDSQAVEVTQLSLFLKMLEDETLSSTMAQGKQTAMHAKVLPDLTKNIVCGNSLIGTDILNGQLFSGEEERKLNPMDYATTFPKVFKQGGFDAVVGNPPYVRIDESKPEYNYVRKKFSTTEFKLDIYTLFIEKCINEVGFKRFGYIIPNTLMTNLTDRKLRKLILDKTHIDEIVNYRIKVFDQAVVHTMVLILDREKNEKEINVTEVEPNNSKAFKLKQSDFAKNENYSFDIRMFGTDGKLLQKIKSKGALFENICEIKQAIKTGDDSKYISNKKIANNFKKVIGGSEMNRYTLSYKERYVDYGKHLACPRDPYIFEVSEKIVIRETGKRITATYDNEQYYLMSSVYSAYLKENMKNYSLKYVLGVLNSTLSQYYMQKLCFDNSSGAFIKARIFHYNQLPIASIDFKKSTDKKQHDIIVNFVEQMLDSKEKLQAAVLEKDISYYQNKCTRLDAQIDAAVYELYGLTEEEIKIVEGGK